MRAPENSTRASSISCCRPIGRAPMRALGIDVDAEAGELLAAPRAPCARQSTTPNRLIGCVAEEDVLGDREVGHDAQLLVHHADAGGERIARRAEVHLLAVDAACGRRTRCARRR